MVFTVHADPSLDPVVEVFVLLPFRVEVLIQSTRLFADNESIADSLIYYQVGTPGCYKAHLVFMRPLSQGHLCVVSCNTTVV